MTRTLSIRRLAVVAGALILGSMAVPAVANVGKNPAKPPKPAITGLALSSHALAATGGAVTVRATVKHGTTCRLTSTPKVAGLPKPVACRPRAHHSSRAVSTTVTLPANTTLTLKTYTLTLTAKSGKRTTANT